MFTLATRASCGSSAGPQDAQATLAAQGQLPQFVQFSSGHVAAIAGQDGRATGTDDDVGEFIRFGPIQAATADNACRP